MKAINSIKYDPDGNRIFKDSSETGKRKFIVDVTGDLPVILMELNSSGGIVKTYIYANSQIIAQHDGDYSASRYFYLHDRLLDKKLNSEEFWQEAINLVTFWNSCTE